MVLNRSENSGFGFSLLGKPGLPPIIYNILEDSPAAESGEVSHDVLMRKTCNLQLSTGKGGALEQPFVFSFMNVAVGGCFINVWLFGDRFLFYRFLTEMAVEQMPCFLLLLFIYCFVICTGYLYCCCYKNKIVSAGVGFVGNLMPLSVHLLSIF